MKRTLKGKKAMADGEYSLSYLETLAVYRKIVTRLVFSDILLIHGSAIAVDGKAYLFTAPSGTGKSTHTRMCREYFKDRAVMVNDDKPLNKQKEAYPTLLSQIYRPIENGEAMIKTLQLADKFMELPLYRLRCNISQDAAITAHEGMK